MKISSLHRLVTPALLAFALSTFPLTLAAQDKPADTPTETPTVEHKSSTPYDLKITDCRKQPTRVQMTDCTTARSQTKTLYLSNATQPADANEILVAVRNLFDPAIKIFLVASRNAITISTYPEEFDRIQAFIKTLDIPHPSYRLTYTITDFDGEKRVGTQHFTVVLVSGQRMTLKQGTKIPVATGKYAGDSKAGSETQFTYLDVGMNFDATAYDIAGGARLDTKIEQSSVAPEPVTIDGVAEPIIRQSVLQGSSSLTLGQPLTLGAVDITGSTHRLDVTVLLEPLH
jgi:type II secretory pathway component GspD/PulD (secretin)